jgi:5S rRNA maturation endonuclease (ribonuclease M5)
MKQETITIKQYLDKKGISYKEVGKELVVRCLFSGCDENSREGEAHLYFNSETSQYDCKKCGAKGNIFTLAKHLGDSEKDVFLSEFQKPAKTRTKITPKFVEELNLAIPDRIRGYLNGRGIPDELISEYQLGWGKFYGKWWIVIPIPDTNGKYQFLKLRKDPDDRSNETKYKFYPAGSEATIYGWESINSNMSPLVVCEGEFDRLILRKFAIPAITSTAGAGTFKKEWLGYLKPFSEIYIAFDKDEAGERESEKLIKTLEKELPEASIYKTTLPDRMTDGKDVSDYFNKYDGNPDEFIYQLSKWKAGVEPIDISKFQPITSRELIEILGLTIKKDEENKLITFLCMLSAYTENSQFNISFNAPSSSGKSYIPLEESSLFPSVDVIKLGNCSPTAFFHEQGEFDKQKNSIKIDLSRKIIIFLEQPHTALLERLRSLLSHDEKEMQSKITDKVYKGGNKTKTVIIRGFPSVIFCSAGLRIDEQEGTRFFLLSPENNQEKIREGIAMKVKKETDTEAYYQWLESNPERKLLKERIRAIKNEKIQEVKFENPEIIERVFLEKRNMLKPRHQRDIGRLISIIKAFTILNVWFRKNENGEIVASKEDIEEGVRIWEKLAESQEYNLPPYVYQLYKEIIVSVFQEKNKNNQGEVKFGITKREFSKKHYETYGRLIPDWQIRQQVLPMLETAGLVHQERDALGDKRTMLMFPTMLLTNENKEINSESNSEVSEENKSENIQNLIF